MNNVIMRKVELTEDYRPLSDRPLVMSGEICAPPFNAGPVYFRGDDGADIPWIPGEFHRVVRCNIADIHAKGPEGCILTIIGGTWKD